MGGGIGMGNTCKPMAVSFQCMTKSTTNKKKKCYVKKKKGIAINETKNTLNLDRIFYSLISLSYFGRQRKLIVWSVSEPFKSLSSPLKVQIPPL